MRSFALSLILYAIGLSFLICAHSNKIIKSGQAPGAAMTITSESVIMPVLIARANEPSRRTAYSVSDDEDGHEDADEDDFKNSKRKDAGVQWIITNKMRSVLVKELGYLESEVDEMEPQIAAVVVERKLRRPLKGMPSSWKKIKPNAVVAKYESVKSLLLRSKLFGFIHRHRKLLLPATIFTASVLAQRENIVKALNDMWKSVSNKDVHHQSNQVSPNRVGLKSIVPKISFFQRTQSSIDSKRDAADSSISTPLTKVDILALDQLQSKSWMSKFRRS